RRIAEYGAAQGNRNEDRSAVLERRLPNGELATADAREVAGGVGHRHAALHPGDDEQPERTPPRGPTRLRIGPDGSAAGHDLDARIEDTDDRIAGAVDVDGAVHGRAVAA